MTTEKVKYGVHSEAGKLRKVMVCSPGLAHQRLTPNNCDAVSYTHLTLPTILLV